METIAFIITSICKLFKNKCSSIVRDAMGRDTAEEWGLHPYLT